MGLPIWSLHPCYLQGKASTIATRRSGSAASARRKHPRHMNGYVTWCRLVESGVMDGWQRGRSFRGMDRPGHAFGGKVETITKSRRSDCCKWRWESEVWKKHGIEPQIHRLIWIYVWVIEAKIHGFRDMRDCFGVTCASATTQWCRNTRSKSAWLGGWTVNQWCSDGNDLTGRWAICGGFEKNDVCHSPVDLIHVILMELKTRSLRLEIAVS